MFIRGGIWLQSQLPSARIYGDYQLIIAINSSFSVNNRTRSAPECHPYRTYAILLRIKICRDLRTFFCKFGACFQLFRGTSKWSPLAHCWWSPGVALGCRASAIIYQNTRVYGVYQLIIAINASTRQLVVEPNATSCDHHRVDHLWHICKRIMQCLHITNT